MTSTTATANPTAGSGERALRKVLLVNTELSVTSGLAGLVFGGPIADLFDVEQVWLIRALGAALLGFAGFVFLIARSKRPTLDTWSAQISLADMGWVAGTVIVIALGWLSTAGAVVMALIGLAVLGLGVGQLRARRSMLAGVTV